MNWYTKLFLHDINNVFLSDTLTYTVYMQRSSWFINSDFPIQVSKPQKKKKKPSINFIKHQEHGILNYVNI